MSSTYTAVCGSGLRASLTLALTAALVWAGAVAWNHAAAIRRECETAFEMEQGAARDLLSTHCKKDGYGQLRECVVASTHLSRDKEHYLTDCAAHDLSEHVGNLIHPVTAVVLWHEATSLSHRFLLVAAFLAVLVLWVNRSALSDAAANYNRAKRDYNAGMPVYSGHVKGE